MRGSKRIVSFVHLKFRSLGNNRRRKSDLAAIKFPSMQFAAFSANTPRGYGVSKGQPPTIRVYAVERLVA